MRKLAIGALASLIFAATSASADEPTIVVGPPPVEATPAREPAAPPATPQPPIYKWSPNNTVLTAGTAIFLAGYGPAFLLGAPSTLGLAGRVVILVFTLGLPCWSGDNPSSYVCNADHGAAVLLVPVAGPFLFATEHPHDTFINRAGRELSPVSNALAYTSGVTQAVGASVMIAGFALGHDTPSEPPRPGPNHSLLMAGLLTFAAAYGEAFVLSVPSLGVLFIDAVSLTDSSSRNETKPPIAGAELAIPFAGPFLFGATNGRDVALNPNGALSKTARVLVFADGAAQLLGGVMMLAALADSNPTRADVAQNGPKTRVLPMVGPGTFGLTLSISSW